MFSKTIFKVSKRTFPSGQCKQTVKRPRKPHKDCLSCKITGPKPETVSGKFRAQSWTLNSCLRKLNSLSLRNSELCLKKITTCLTKITNLCLRKLRTLSPENSTHCLSKELKLNLWIYIFTLVGGSIYYPAVAAAEVELPPADTTTQLSASCNWASVKRLW